MFDDDYDSMETPPRPELSSDVQALINNGLEFLDKARIELEASKHKFSIVSFWTAVEILLKVPLVHEHWTLACSGKKIVRSKYITGDFQSVTYDETCARLDDVLETPLSKETKAAFDKIRQHRNRVVHFYHPAFSASDQHQIQKEQADAWFALNRLMRDEWQSLLGDSHTWKLAFGETRMLRGNEFYAAVRLKQIQPELAEMADKGITLSDCPDCKQRAMVTLIETTGNDDRKLYDTRCKVCTSSYRHISLTCPECEKPQSLSEGEDDFTCEHCRYSEDRVELLNEETASSLDQSELFYLPAGCTNCMSPNSVCRFGEDYLCTRCLAHYPELQECQSCFHFSDSVSHLSHFVGCEFCDGDPRYHDD